MPKNLMEDALAAVPLDPDHDIDWFKGGEFDGTDSPQHSSFLKVRIVWLQSRLRVSSWRRRRRLR
jgi:hypothetical protein